MSHPRFLKNLDIAKLRRNIQNQRAAVNIENAKAHIGPEASQEKALAIKSFKDLAKDPAWIKAMRGASMAEERRIERKQKTKSKQKNA